MDIVIPPASSDTETGHTASQLEQEAVRLLDLGFIDDHGALTHALLAVAMELRALRFELRSS